MFVHIKLGCCHGLVTPVYPYIVFKICTNQFIFWCRFIAAIEEMPKKDLEDNRAIGEFGAEAILAHHSLQDPVRILTHCNTGSLATSAYGTALGVIRSLFARNKIGETNKF